MLIGIQYAGMQQQAIVLSAKSTCSLGFYDKNGRLEWQSTIQAI